MFCGDGYRDAQRLLQKHGVRLDSSVPNVTVRTLGEAGRPRQRGALGWALR
jgi:hypothetical protein